MLALVPVCDLRGDLRLGLPNKKASLFTSSHKGVRSMEVKGAHYPLT